MFDAPFQSNFEATSLNLSGLYVVGGIGRSHLPDTFDGHKLAVENYRPDSDLWIVRGNLRTGRSNGGAWGFGPDGALMAGGQLASDPAPEQETLRPIRDIVARRTASVLKLIPPETWVAGPESLGAQRAGFATSVIGSTGWGYGGDQTFGNSPKIWAVRPYTTTWVAPQGTMPTGRTGATAGTINDKGYIAGGFFDRSIAQDRDIYEWNPATETVVNFGSSAAVDEGVLKWRVVQQAGGAVGDSLYLFGGILNNRRPVSPVTQQYTPATNTTVSKAHQTAPTEKAASFTDDHGIYQIGGLTEDVTQIEGIEPTKNTNAVQRYDTLTDIWSTVASLVGELPHNKRWMWEPNGPMRNSAIGFNV